jgi:hypothetical protein
MSGDDNYGDVQQPAGGYGGAGGADASTGYGDVQNPTSPYGGGKTPAPAAPTLDLLAQIKADLQSLNVSLEGADLLDMKQHKNHKEFEDPPVKFGAWTNSSQQIFVSLVVLQSIQKAFGSKNGRAAALVAIRHEIFHVGQFKGNTPPGPPQNFADMIRFEADAYPRTVQFMDDQNTSTFLVKTIGATQQFLTDQLHDPLQAQGDEFKARMTEQDYKDNDANKKWLIKKTDLPAKLGTNKDYKIGDLYKT